MALRKQWLGDGNFRKNISSIPHPLLVPWSRRGRAILVLPLRAVQTVQSLSACTRVHFTLLLPLFRAMIADCFHYITTVLAISNYTVIQSPHSNVHSQRCHPPFIDLFLQSARNQVISKKRQGSARISSSLLLYYSHVHKICFTLATVWRLYSTRSKPLP